MAQDIFLSEEFTGKLSQTEKVSVSKSRTPFPHGQLENYIQINVAKAKTVDFGVNQL